MPDLRPIRVIFLLIVLGVLGNLGACGQHSSPWYSGLCDLERVPLSATLKPVLDAGVASLSEPDEDSATVADYAASLRLRNALRPSATRQAAADEVYQRWQDNPHTVLWMQIAYELHQLAQRPDDLARMLAEPTMSDTTTALGALVRGRSAPTTRESLHFYRKAERLKDQLSPLDRTQLLLRMVTVDRTEGRRIAAVERLINGLPEARRVGGHRLASVYWYQIAYHLATSDHLDDALHAATLAAAHARSVGAQYQFLLCRIRIAIIQSQRGEYETARRQLEMFADIGDSLDYSWVLQSSLDKAAQISCDLGDYQYALRLDRRILKHLHKMRDPVNLPRSLGSIAHDFRMMGQLDSTYVYLKRAEAEVNASGLDINRRKMAELLAGYYCQVGQYAVAESLVVAAANVDDVPDSRWAQATILLDLVPSALEIGRTDLAYEWLGRVAKIREVLPYRGQHDNFLADFETLSARLLADQGEIRLAGEALARAREAVAVGGGEGKQWNLDAQSGELALQRGDVRQAEKYFMACLSRALQGDNPRQIDRSRFQLGQLYLAEGQYANAEAMFAPLGDEETFGTGYRTGLTSLLLRGLTNDRQGHHDAAIAIYDDGLGRLNTHSPADLALRFHLAHAQALTAIGHYQEADAELSGVLAKLATQPHLVRFADLPVFRTDIERDTREAKARNLQQGRLVAADKLARAMLTTVRPGLVERLLNPTAEGPALVYFLGDTGSWVWRVGPDGLTVRDLPSRDRLQELLNPVLVDLGQPDRPLDTARLSRLADLLLGDLAEHWAPGTTLTLVPDGPLYQTPWAALPLGTQVVLDRGPLRETDPRVGPRQTAPRRTPGQLSLLAIGCDQPDGTAARLHEAEAEAASVISLWPGSETDLALGPEANWPALLSRGLENYDVIHIASHAEVHQGLGGRSTLRLAARTREGSAEATPVTMAAVRQLNLKAELVFLSSCRAGLPVAGSNSSRDFTEAFLTAGAHTVIASTAWVDDEAARQLAEGFYRHWRDGASPASALQAARQEVRTRWPHPAYWAFLRLTGDGR